MMWWCGGVVVWWCGGVVMMVMGSVVMWVMWVDVGDVVIIVVHTLFYSCIGQIIYFYHTRQPSNTKTLRL